MMTCECFAHVLEHIPIADLANIIHDYAAAEPRADQHLLDFAAGDHEYSICYFARHPHPRIGMYSRMRKTTFYKSKYECNALIDETQHLSSKIFQPDTRSMLSWWLNDVNATMPFDWYANTAYKILIAEETGGHLHPDPRIDEVITSSRIMPSSSSQTGI